MDEQISFEFEPRPTIKGFPELRWTGKRPYRATQYYPAQLRESYGHAQDGWMNKIFWGDNLQVMSHMMKEYRGRIDLIYIDPPFDSKADYKKKVRIHNQQILNDSLAFEEKQYGDIWTNDEYIQFMYERLILLRELLSDNGTIFLHCDWHKVHYLRCIMGEVFGSSNFLNEIVWKRTRAAHSDATFLGKVHDTILVYSKSDSAKFNQEFTEHSAEYIKRFTKEEHGRKYMLVPLHGPGQGEPRMFFGKMIAPPAGRCWPVQKKIDELIAQNRVELTSTGTPSKKSYLDENKGNPVSDWWDDIIPLNPVATERTDYPTQKPQELLERVIRIATNPGDLVFDCFMGSGTTQAVAMKLGRRFIGADINLGAVQTTTKRLISIAADLKSSQKSRGYDFQEPTLSIAASPFASYLSSSKETPHDGQESAEEIKVLSQEDIKYTGFEVYNVNNYDFFRNPIEARDLLIAALEIQPFPQSNLWDGELDGRMVKIMPVNRIATKADLKELLANLPYKTYEKRKEENASQPVERITLVCMGHEPDLKAALEQELIEYKVDVEIMDILRDKASIQLKRDSEAEVVREGEKLVIRAFYPMNLMQKLSLQKEYIEDWRQLVDSVMVDWNYDGVVMQPSVTDIPSKDEWVSGIYDIPSDAGTIKVKITDLLSESLELEVS
ncbi:site-specific DNA-methyltransferase [Selenomonas flueggei]|uniref:site-specific DNA-methyltransferase n=1 Tax=Selenomonas flueggei TaxID=135080 RepID=UPI002672FEB7|nr:site-specific DNA-methyltransferase [Selenomonas flueggei]